jgi:arylsulfatase A-like enzyme
MTGRPNFLFIITDQQRFDHLGCMGDPLLKTPRIDALAAAGTLINRFYVASPVCQPNRASLMTGRMPSLHGVRHNGINLDLDATTFVHQLRDAGYRTALVGKSHLQNFLDLAPAYPPKPTDSNSLPPAPRHAEAWRNRYDESCYEQELAATWSDPAFQLPQPYYGFDHVKLCTGHGDRVGGEYRRWLEEGLAGQEVRSGPQFALAQSASGAPQTYQTAVPEERHPTAYVAQETINYLETYADSEREAPFFLQCAFPDPHHPFAPPGHYWEMYDPSEVTLPLSFYESNRDQTPALAHINEQAKDGYPSHWTAPFVAQEEPARDMIAKSYGMISFIDDAVGQIVDCLERTALRENTVIIFTSDHGDWLGAHGLFLKGPLHYQPLIRVPFIWNDLDPAYNSGLHDGIGSTIDIGATILARASLSPFRGNQGINLLPLLAGDASAGHENVLVEQTTQYLYLGFDRLVRVFSLVSKRWRLTVWEGESWGELYDLKDDPHEMENLWSEPEYAGLKADLLLQMVHRIQSLNDESPYPAARA